VKKAKTDPEPLPSEAKGLAGRPKRQPCRHLCGAGWDNPCRQVLRDFAGQGFGAFKPALAKA
jgi:tryptophanyl-tRNA synthetase